MLQPPKTIRDTVLAQSGGLVAEGMIRVQVDSTYHNGAVVSVSLCDTDGRPLIEWQGVEIPEGGEITLSGITVYVHATPDAPA